MDKCCTFQFRHLFVPQAQEQSSRFNGALAHPANVQTAQDLSKKDLSGLVFCRLYNVFWSEKK